MDWIIGLQDLYQDQTVLQEAGNGVWESHNMMVIFGHMENVQIQMNGWKY